MNGPRKHSSSTANLGYQGKSTTSPSEAQRHSPKIVWVKILCAKNKRTVIRDGKCEVYPMMSGFQQTGSWYEGMPTYITRGNP